MLKVYSRQNHDPTSLDELIDLIGNIALAADKQVGIDSSQVNETTMARSGAVGSTVRGFKIGRYPVASRHC